jgi:hypothetical protein
MTIKMNNADWNGISSDEQQQIRDIIGKNFDGQKVEVSDTKSQTADGSTCETLCNTAEALAEQACSALPWPASTVCKIAAEKAGDYCRSRC